MANTISRVTQSIVSDAKDNLKQAISDYFTGEDGTLVNILHKYRTFNYNVTLAIVSAQEFATGSYKRSGFDHIVFKSSGKPPAGGVTSQRGINQSLKKIQDILSVVGGSGGSGDYDFYLQELNIKSSMADNKDIATNIRMKILEPYSHDNLMTNILQGLRKKGWVTQNRNNTFVLKIDFVGWRDDKEEPEVIPYSTRYYPMIMVSLKANVTQEGTVYEIVGAPVNDTGRYNDVNSMSDVLTLTGETVKEVMDDFAKKLNEVAEKKAKDANKKPHKYEIQFAPGTEDIASKNMYDPSKDRNLKSEAFKDKTRYTEGEVNKRIQAASGENNKLTFTVPCQNGITNCIDSLILDSRYVIDKIEKNFKNELDGNKQVLWWRVITQVQVIEFDYNTNTDVKKIIFLIIPRQVPPSRISDLLTPGASANAADFDARVARTYEWLFTGNNKDIISFRWNYDFLFQRVLGAGMNRSVLPETQNQTSAPGPAAEVQFPDIGSDDGAPDPASRQEGSVADSSRGSSGRKSGTEIVQGDPLRNLAKELASLFNFPYEQIGLDLDILGDPMWLGTQFIDNAIGTTGGGIFTSDGGIAFRTSDPMIKILAYGPTDFNQDGFLAATANEDKAISSFSAYYRIVSIESSFQNGVFRQKLRGNRLPKVDMSQGTDYTVFGFGVRL